MTEAAIRSTVPLKLNYSQIEEAILRGREQESIYGHNTGHFSLKVEKENTVIGVLGEIAVRDFLASSIVKALPGATLTMREFGAEFDLEISHNKEQSFIHVKSGLWKTWPEEHWHFGIHADQGIQNSGYPLVLVSFLRSKGTWPEILRIEGFITSDYLNKAQLIKRGQKFPSTGVVSRTDNLLTKFSDYQHISKLSDVLGLK